MSLGKEYKRVKIGPKLHRKLGIISATLGLRGVDAMVRDEMEKYAERMFASTYQAAQHAARDVDQPSLFEPAKPAKDLVNP